MVTFVGGTWDGVTRASTISEDRNGQYVSVLPRVGPKRAAPADPTAPVEPVEPERYRVVRRVRKSMFGRPIITTYAMIEEEG